MRRRALGASVLGLLFVVGCKGGGGGGGGDDGDETETGEEPVSVALEGAVAKGPFVLGSTISVSPIDDMGSPTGEVFNTQTVDDLGRFEVTFEAAGFVALEGVGFYYNEVAGQLSDAPLTLRAFYEIDGPGQQSAYVNVITHLAYGRVKELVGQGTSFDDAIVQAEQELVAALTVGPDGFAPGKSGVQMNLLGGDDEANAYLLCAASILAQRAQIEAGGPDGPVDANLQELVNTISEQMTQLGQIAPGIQDDLRAAQREVDGDAVMANLQVRFDDLGLGQDVPDIHRVLDNDLDGIVNRDDNCPLDENADQADADDNGIGDVCEVECGNGKMEEQEECDDGNVEDGDGCNADCTISGQLAWEDLSAGSDENAHELAVAPDAVLAYAVGIGSGSEVRALDTGDASEIWKQAFADDAPELEFDPDGNVVVSYSTYPDGTLRRLDASDGSGLDEYVLTGGLVYGLAINGSGDIAFAGAKDIDGWIGVMDEDAVVDWEVIDPGMLMGNHAGYSVALRPDDELAYGVGRSSGGRVHVHALDGSEVWQQPVGDTSGWVDVAAGPMGEVYACWTQAVDGEETNAVLTRLKPDGTKDWDRSVDGPTSGQDNCQGLAVDATGHVVWTYNSEVYAQDSGPSHLEKLDAAGELVWSVTYDAGVSRLHVSRGVGVDAANAVYWLVTHDAIGSKKTYLAKYTP